jgi:hypothetical protein
MSSISSILTVPVYKFPEYYDRMCRCGHKLSYHGFTQSVGYPNPYYVTLYVSQCCFCGSKDGKFICNSFELIKEKNEDSLSM